RGIASSVSQPPEDLAWLNAPAASFGATHLVQERGMPQQPTDSVERRRLGGGAIAAIVGGAVLVIFIIQNREDVAFDFLWINFTWPLWLYTIIVAVFGALLWLGLGVLRRHRRREERREDRRA